MAEKRLQTPNIANVADLEDPAVLKQKIESVKTKDPEC